MRRERGTERLNKISSHAARSGGKKKGKQCHSKRHRLVSLFFFFFLNVWNDVVLEKTRRFIQMWRQKRANVQISLPIIFVPFNCIPANFDPRPHSWPCFPRWSLASDLRNLALNWSINSQFLQLGPSINSKQLPYLCAFSKLVHGFGFSQLNP